MFNLYQARLQQLEAPENLVLLTGIQRGIEKEGLRVTSQAKVAQTGHPKALGSALTHSSITTDYSEALLEFITPVTQGVDDSIDCLQQLHTYTQRNIGSEYLWPGSMPCRLDGQKSIPIAQYGSSNIGQMKHVYRQGLANRYGRIMQSIAGIHYNFSLPETLWPQLQNFWGHQGDLQAFKSECYFALIRNFRRHSWLLSYLFGASPVLDSSFMGSGLMGSQPHQLTMLGKDTLGLPYATSLRMSDLGYQSKAQASLEVSYSNLDCYINSLTQAIRQPYPEYEKIGLKANGEYRQLNSNILQIENEYYSDIRPKRVTLSEETPSEALRERGVEYVEVRILDVNPLMPVGIDAEQIRFLDAFLLFCMLSESDEITATEYEEIKHNQQKILLEGRRPSLMLQQAGKPVAFSHLASKLLDEIIPVARLLDRAHGSLLDQTHASQQYLAAVAIQMDKVNNSELTPSGQIMREINDGIGFTDLMLLEAKKQRHYFSLQPLSSAQNEELKHQAAASLQQQKQLEASDKISFDEFLQKVRAPVFIHVESKVA